jgi:ATP-GRASP peptide maturase of grasp-with-spasm system
MKNKSIIIFSENDDVSTMDVMKWCKIKGYEVHRINCDDRNLKICISADSLTISTSFDLFSITPNSICWFRRAEYASIYVTTQEKDPVTQEMEIFNFTERQQTYNALKFWIKDNCQYSSECQNATFNKADVLLKAKKQGIKIPDWIVTEEKEPALSFAKQYSHVACKPFASIFFHDKDVTYNSLTEKLTYSDIESFPPRFIPRFFQQYIDKKYELRSFYFHGKFFTYAIFSQNNPKTAVDFRNYDDDKPNRCVPFDLPPDYCAKLELLTKSLKLDTGSFDILVDSNDEYYFLEVNPVGQFGAGSYDCNANIEEHIANYLIEMML